MKIGNKNFQKYKIRFKNYDTNDILLVSSFPLQLLLDDDIVIKFTSMFLCGHAR